MTNLSVILHIKHETLGVKTRNSLPSSDWSLTPLQSQARPAKSYLGHTNNLRLVKLELM